MPVEIRPRSQLADRASDRGYGLVLECFEPSEFEGSGWLEGDVHVSGVNRLRHNAEIGRRVKP
jgi:hypothetical protein